MSNKVNISPRELTYWITQVPVCDHLKNLNKTCPYCYI